MGKVQLTYRDLIEMRSRAIKAFTEIQPRMRIPGMPDSGLTTSDLQALSWLDAAITLLGSKNLLVKDTGGVAAAHQTDSSVWEP